jgi:hypothetical protein
MIGSPFSRATASSSPTTPSCSLGSSATKKSDCLIALSIASRVTTPGTMWSTSNHTFKLASRRPSTILAASSLSWYSYERKTRRDLKSLRTKRLITKLYAPIAIPRLTINNPITNSTPKPMLESRSCASPPKASKLAVTAANSSVAKPRRVFMSSLQSQPAGKTSQRQVELLYPGSGEVIFQTPSRRCVQRRPTRTIQSSSGQYARRRLFVGWIVLAT